MQHKNMNTIEKLQHVYTRPRVWIMALLGFASGLPILLVFSSLSAWLSDASVSKATIGFASWIGLAYSIKYLWSPLVDKMPIPILTKTLGRRRSWMLVSQIAIVISILGMAYTDPAKNLALMIAFAVGLAFSSATQDITIDAFRIDSGKDEEQASMAALYVYGYRIAMLLAGAGVLWLADTGVTTYDYTAWKNAYMYMAFAILPCMITVLFLKEPSTVTVPYKNIREWTQQAYINPFADFYNRYKHSFILLILVIFTFRLSDILMGVMANPFYLDMGFSKSEIAGTVKIFGFWMTMAGLALGGILMVAFGLRNTMLLACGLSAGTNILFALLASVGNDIGLLAFVISADNISAGIATTSFVAYLSSLINKQFSATQYALLFTIATIVPKILAGYSGVIVESVGYSTFFIGTAVVGFPTLIFIYLSDKKMSAPEKKVV